MDIETDPMLDLLYEAQTDLITNNVKMRQKLVNEYHAPPDVIARWDAEYSLLMRELNLRIEMRRAIIAKK